MLSELEKQYAVGAFLFGNSQYQTKFVEGLFKATDPAMFDICRETYCSAYEDSDNYYLQRILYEEQINNEALDRISNELINGRVGNQIDVNTIIDSANNLYKEPTPVPTDISDLNQDFIPRDKIITNNSYINELMGTAAGIEKGRLYLFTSKAKGGKSIVLQNMAQLFANVSTDLKVCYLSLENDINDIVIRAREMTQFLTKPNSTEMLNNSYSVIYSPKATLSDIKEYLKDYDVLIVDYLARIVPEKKYESTYEQYGDYTDFLHYLAADTNKIIISACQLSRAAISNFKNTQDDIEKWKDAFLNIDQDCMADSMNIIRNADMVITTMYNKLTDCQFFNVIASRTRTDIDACFIKYTLNTLRLNKVGGIL